MNLGTIEEYRIAASENVGRGRNICWEQDRGQYVSGDKTRRAVSAGTQLRGQYLHGNKARSMSKA